jgi:hypothetical protein
MEAHYLKHRRQISDKGTASWLKGQGSRERLGYEWITTCLVYTDTYTHMHMHTDRQL